MDTLERFGVVCAVFLAFVPILTFFYVVRIHSKVNEILRRQARPAEPAGRDEAETKRPV